MYCMMRLTNGLVLFTGANILLRTNILLLQGDIKIVSNCCLNLMFQKISKGNEIVLKINYKNSEIYPLLLLLKIFRKSKNYGKIKTQVHATHAFLEENPLYQDPHYSLPLQL